MKKATLFDLLEDIRLRKIDGERANTAFNEFYERHKPQIIGICRRECTKYELTSDKGVVSDITQEVLISFFLNIKSFKKELYKSEKALLGGVLSWIQKLCMYHCRRFIKMYSFRRNVDTDFVISRGIFFDIESVEVEENENQLASVKARGGKIIEFDKSILHQALNKLLEREREILLTSLHYYSYYLPSTEIKRLTKKYKITPAYLRTIKKRTLQKIINVVLDLIGKNSYSEIKEFMVKKNEEAENN